MATLEAIKNASSTSTSVFEAGRLSVHEFKIDTSDASSPPKPLLIVTPTVKGEYPVFVFLHGTFLSNDSYTQLFRHVATHGFIAVAPQLYSCWPASGEDELKSAELVADWLTKGLQSVLQSVLHQNVEANLRKVALAGHSRGGKTAFSLALGQASTSQIFSILIGLDPVAGTRKGHQVPPNVLKYEPRSMNLGIPVMVIGTGLGNKSPFLFGPCCAPDGVNHKDFFNECQPPCCYFVTKDYGHMDMLDDNNAPWFIGIMCKSGNGPREPMRRCVGGLVVAFMRDYLDGEKGDLQSIVHEPGLAPVKLDPVQFIKS